MHIMYCLFALNIFSIFVFYACFGMLLKGMVESYQLSKDELLTPNIDEVMVVWIFRRRAKNTQNRQKLDLAILVSFFFGPHPLVCYITELIFPELRNHPRWGKTPIQNGPRKHGEKTAPHGIAHFLIQIHFSALCVGSQPFFFGLIRTNEYRAVYKKAISMTLKTF